MKIAVIEDEKPIREGLVHILNKISPEYQVVGSAENGAEGLILLEEEMPDLIMLHRPLFFRSHFSGIGLRRCALSPRGTRQATTPCSSRRAPTMQ